VSKVNMVEAGKKAGTIRNTFFVVQQVMEEQVRLGRVPLNPCRYVRLPRMRDALGAEDERHYLTRARCHSRRVHGFAGR
jgi:hypothetical protein